MNEIRLHIGGADVAAGGGAMFERRSPITGEVVSRSAGATADDARAACAAAAKAFPGLAELKDFEKTEEWYAFTNMARDLHVILVQDTSTMDVNGRRAKQYMGPNYPSTWARMQGKGRVFYTSMGHREDVWTNPLFQSMLLGGIAWAVRNVDADVTPRPSRWGDVHLARLTSVA